MLRSLFHPPILHRCRPLHAAPLLSVALLFGTSPSRAQGIPVIDAANLIQTVQQVINDITKIRNQVQQIQQLQSQIASMNGTRMLGDVDDNPLLHNYVPPNAYALVDAVDSTGYAGLSASAKALRDQGMVYNCEDRSGTARTECQSALARPYQYKGLLQDAMHAAAGRVGQISALMAQINATTDQKSVQEIQARIGAENALLAHEMSQVQMLQGLSESDARIAQARDRERQDESLTRSRKLISYLR